MLVEFCQQITHVTGSSLMSPSFVQSWVGVGSEHPAGVAVLFPIGLLTNRVDFSSDLMWFGYSAALSPAGFWPSNRYLLWTYSLMPGVISHAFISWSVCLQSSADGGQSISGRGFCNFVLLIDVGS